MDRAGLVGDDGPTHHGAFDIAYLRPLPNIVLMAPRDEAALVHMLHTAVCHDDGPIALRYPRGEGTGIELPARPEAIEVGTGELLREGERVAIVGYGTGVGKGLEAADLLAERGLEVTVADARFAKPIDAALMAQLAGEHELLVTVEEGVLMGGFGTAVWETLSEGGATPRILRVGLPDRYVTHGKPALLHEEVGFTAQRITERIEAAIAEPGRWSRGLEAGSRLKQATRRGDGPLAGGEMSLSRSADRCGEAGSRGVARGDVQEGLDERGGREEHRGGDVAGEAQHQRPAQKADGDSTVVGEMRGDRHRAALDRRARGRARRSALRERRHDEACVGAPSRNDAPERSRRPFRARHGWGERCCRSSASPSYWLMATRSDPGPLRCSGAAPVAGAAPSTPGGAARPARARSGCRAAAGHAHHPRQLLLLALHRRSQRRGPSASHMATASTIFHGIRRPRATREGSRRDPFGRGRVAAASRYGSRDG